MSDSGSGVFVQGVSLDPSGMLAGKRTGGRPPTALREIRLEVGYSKYAEGSCLVHWGDTRVLCTASVDGKPPSFLRERGGWVTAEYAMLPRSGTTRSERHSGGRGAGRSYEIQRLIGRALRAVTDLSHLDRVQVKIDCDVIQADGGTRTAAITGSYVALYQAFGYLRARGVVDRIPLVDSVAAVSCGICRGEILVDLDYSEDAAAAVDANFVLTGSGLLVEVQAAAEDRPYDESQLHAMLKLTRPAIATLTDLQKRALAEFHPRSMAPDLEAPG